MKIDLKYLALLVSTTAMVTGFSSSAKAQSSGSTTDNPTRTSERDTIGNPDIVVTAQKRSESLLKVSAPVTALSSETLAQQHAASIADYVADVPGLSLVTSQPGQTVVQIRGIGTGFGAAIPATVGTYVDDVPYGSSTNAAYGSIGTLDLDPASLDRVEVLRGPQGTLYGASALGGLIKYVTRAPSLTTTSGQVTLDGNATLHGGQGGGVRAGISAPLVEGKLGFSVNGFYRRDPGFIADPSRNKRNINYSRVDGGRAALLWQPTDRFSAEASAIIQDNYSPGTSSADLRTDFTPIYGKYQQVRWGDEIWKFRVRLYSLRASYDLGWATATSITSYATREADWHIDFTNKFGSLLSGITGAPNLAVYDNIHLDNHKTTQELRLASPDQGAFTWLVGAYYTHERSTKAEAFQNPYNKTTGVIFPIAAGIFTDTLNDRYTEYAGYGDVTYRPTDRLKLQAGLRYASNSERSVTPFSGILFGPADTYVGSSSDRSLTYLVSPSFEIDRDNMVYARVASGYRPGGPTNVSNSNLLAGVPATYQPDRLTNYEVGYKASYPALAMTLDVSAFYIDWKNIQLLQVVNGFTVTANGGAATSRGGELTWTWRPARGLNLSVNSAYTDAHLTRDAAAVGGKAGDQLPGSAKFTATLRSEYGFPIRPGVQGFAGGDFEFLGPRTIDYVANTPAGYVRPQMPGYAIVNLHAGLTIGSLGVEIYAKNVADTYGITRFYSQVRNGYSAPWAGAIVQPRTIGVSLTEKF